MSDNKNIIEEDLKIYLYKILKKYNDNNINNLIKYIRDNRDHLNVYFFIGSGLLKYINQDDSRLKLWSDMAAEEYKNINIKKLEFIDYITIDLKYNENIEIINQTDISNLINDDLKTNSLNNANLRKIWKNFANFFSRTNKKNKLNIITTNHCNTIKKYFELENCEYTINECREFFDQNYSIFKIHNLSKDKFIWNIETYTDLFRSGKLEKIYELFENYSKSGNNLYFIFGTSYSELHIQVLIKTIIDASKESNKIVWIREFKLATDSIKDKEEIKNIQVSLDKMLDAYDANKHLIIFTNRTWDNPNIKNELSADNVLGYINNKISKLFKSGIGLYESKLFSNKLKNKSGFIDNNIIKEICTKYKKSSNKNNYLNNLFKKKDFISIQIIIINVKDEMSLNWYISNLEKFQESNINADWFISIVHHQEKEYLKYINAFINKISTLEFSFINNEKILYLFSFVKVNKYNYKWIISKSLEIFKNLGINIWWERKNVENSNYIVNKKRILCEDFILNFLKAEIKNIFDIPNYSIHKKYHIFYISKLKDIINREFSVLDIIFEIYNINLIYLVKNLYITRHNDPNYISRVCILEVKNYLSNYTIDELMNLISSDKEEKLSFISLFWLIKKNEEFIDLKSKLVSKYGDLSSKLSEIEISENKLDKPLVETKIDEISDLIKQNKIKNIKYIKSILENNIFNNNLKKEIDFYKVSEIICKILDWIFCNYFNKLNNNEEIKNFLFLLNEYIVKNSKDNDFKFVFFHYGKFKKISINNLKIIFKFLIDNKMFYFVKYLISQFLVNSKFNPTYDFYVLYENKISFIQIFKYIFELTEKNNGIELIDIFDDEYLELYINIIKSNFNLIDSKFYFFKVIYGLWYSDLSEKDIDFFKIDETFFNVLIKILKKDYFINNYCYITFLNFLFKRSASEAINIFLSNEWFQFININGFVYKNEINFIFENLKKENITNNEKDLIKNKIKNFLDIDFEHRKIFIFNYENIIETIDKSRILNEYIPEKPKIEYNEIMFFIKEIENIFKFYEKNDDAWFDECKICNYLLSILVLYEYNGICISDNDLWHSIKMLLNEINLTSDSHKNISNKIRNFIRKNYKFYKYKID